MQSFFKTLSFRAVLAVSLLAVVTSFSSAAKANVHGPTPQDLLNSGRVDDALTILQKRIAESKDDAEAFNLLCRAYYQLGMWDQSIKTGERSVQLEPGNSSYHMWLGRAYGQKADNSNFFVAPGMAKRSREQLEKAVELDGNNVHARTDLAEFYVEAPGIIGGGKDKARVQAENAGKNDPAIPFWVNGRLAEKEHDWAAAELNYKAAIAASHVENASERWLNLASFYRRRGQYPEMEDAINKAMGKQKRANLLVDAASLLLRAGRSLPQAAQLVTNYLSGKEKAEEAPAFHAHYILGQILEKEGDREGAIKEYKAALQLAKDYGAAREALHRLQNQR